MQIYFEQLSRFACPLTRLIFFLLFLLLGATWSGLQHQILNSVSVAKEYSAIQVNEVQIAPGRKDLTIGRAELGQRPGINSAEPKHIELNDKDGSWLVSNIASKRRVLIEYDQFGEIFARRWPLRNGDRILIGTTVFKVRQLDTGKIYIDRPGRTYSLDVASGFVRELKPIPDLNDAECGVERGDSYPYLKWLAINHSWIIDNKKERTLLTFGGGADCGDRIAMPEISPSSIRLTYQNGMFFLAPGKSGLLDVLFCAAEWQCGNEASMRANGIRFSEIQWPLFTDKAVNRDDSLVYLSNIWPKLGGAVKIIVGKTHYTVSHGKDGILLLTPVINVHRFFNDRLRPKTEQGKVLDDEESVHPESFFVNYYEKEAQKRLAGVIVDEKEWLKPEVDSTPYSSRILTYLKQLLVERSWEFDRKSSKILLVFMGPLLILGLFRAFRLAKTVSRSTPGTVFLLYIVSALTLFLILLGGELYTDYRVLLGNLLIVEWLTVCLLLLRAFSLRLYFFWSVISSLLVMGALTLQLLAVGAPSTNWIIYDYKHLLTLSVVLFVVAWLQVTDLERLKGFVAIVAYPKGFWQTLVRYLPVIVVAFWFLFWVVSGSESGVVGFQPVEFGKFVTVWMLAVFASNIDYRRRHAGFWVRLTGFTLRVTGLGLVFTAIFMGAPVLKSDYSPVLILILLGILMMVLVGVWLWLHRFFRNHITRSRRVRPPGGIKNLRRGRSRLRGWFGIELLLASLGVIVALLFSGIILEQIDHVQRTHTTLEALDYNTPQERVAVWESVEQHPEWGNQLINSRRLLGDNPHYDWGHLLPFELPVYLSGSGTAVEPFGIHRVNVLKLAAVQDDFVLAFFINRFGLIWTQILILLQLLLIWLMVDTVVRKYAWESGDYIDDAIRQILGFTTLGGAVMLTLHWFISWGNTFGFLPIMGQPMTWLSSANSHIIFLALPILLCTLTLLRIPDSRWRRKTLQLDSGPVLGKPQQRILMKQNLKEISHKIKKLI